MNISFFLSIQDLVFSFTAIFLIIIFITVCKIPARLKALIITGAVFRFVYAAGFWWMTIPLYVDSDAVDFINAGQHVADGIYDSDAYGYGAKTYVYAIGLLFYLFGTAPVSVIVVTIFVWAITLIMTAELWKRMHNQEMPSLAMASMVLLPYEFIITATPMREAWQGLALIFSVILFWDILVGRWPARNIILGCLFFGVISALSHVVCIVVAMLCPLIAIALKANHGGRLITRLLGFALIVVPIVYFCENIAEISQVISAEQVGRQQGLGSLDYVIPTPGGDALSIFLFLFESIGHFWMGPFPWEVSTVVGLYAMLCGWFRCVLFFALLIAVWRSSGENNNLGMKFVMLVCLGVSVLWAMGTANHGTALRHSYMTLPLLVVGAKPFWDFLINFTGGCCGYQQVRDRKRIFVE